MPDMKDTPLAELDLEEIAAALIMLVPGCLALGHESIQSTLGYYHGESGGAGAFIKDLFTLKPGEVARKWYGGEKRAKSLFASAMGKALFADDAEPAA